MAIVVGQPRVANEPVAASRRSASPSPAWRRKLARRCGPCGVSTDSVELDAFERERHVADAHHHPIDLAHGGHPKLGGRVAGSTAGSGSARP